jgi:hypothetical protein
VSVSRGVIQVPDKISLQAILGDGSLMRTACRCALTVVRARIPREPLYGIQQSWRDRTAKRPVRHAILPSYRPVSTVLI